MLEVLVLVGVLMYIIGDVKVPQAERRERGSWRWRREKREQAMEERGEREQAMEERGERRESRRRRRVRERGLAMEPRQGRAAAAIPLPPSRNIKFTCLFSPIPPSPPPIIHAPTLPVKPLCSKLAT